MYSHNFLGPTEVILISSSFPGLSPLSSPSSLKCTNVRGFFDDAFSGIEDSEKRSTWTNLKLFLFCSGVRPKGQRKTLSVPFAKNILSSYSSS